MIQIQIQIHLFGPIADPGDNGVARIFVWGGGGTRPMSPGRFSVISRSRPDSVGGGVVADLHKRNTFAGGGGVVAYIFFC